MSSTDLTPPPSTPGWYAHPIRLGRWTPIKRLVSWFGLILVLGLMAGAAPSSAQAESIEISHGANPTQDIALSISVSGVADGHHRLYVVVHASGEACATYPDFETGTHLASGESVSSGSFSKEYSFTPPQPGTYTICAYLDEQEYDTPDVTTTGSFTAVMPTASVSVEVSGELTQEVPMKVRVSGTTEVARKLYVVVHASGEACATYPDFETGTHLASGESLSAGSYSEEYSFTPPQPGIYTVCGYVDEAEYGTPDATGSGSFTAGMPAGSVSFSINPTATENGPVNIKVSGSTEVQRKLYVVVHASGEACATYPDFETGTHLASGESLGAGGYSKEYSYTPNATTTYTVCGYVDEAEYGTPDATGSATFTNITPQTRAEESAWNAEKAKYEAERAAEAKREQEAAAKKKYEEEAPAREAAEQAANIARYNAEVAAAKAAAHRRPVKHLSVNAAAHTGHSRNDPGYTNLDLNTSPYAHITIKLSRYGHITQHLEWGESSKAVAMVIPWRLQQPRQHLLLHGHGQE